MKIDVVLGPFLSVPPAPSGAVEKSWQGLCQVWASEGHNVTILCQNATGPVSKHGVNYVSVPSFRRSKHLALDLMKDLLYSVCAGAKAHRDACIISNTFWLPIVAAALPRNSRMTLVVDVQRMPKGQLRLYNRADLFRANSRAVHDAIVRELRGQDDRVRTVPNPVDVTTFCPARVWDARSSTILYAGRIHPEKGIHLLVQAFRRLWVEHPDVTLRLVGPIDVAQGGGGPEYLRTLQNYMGRAPVDIRAPEYVPAALARHFQEVQFFCYPSLAERGETFGVAPLEAMASGLAPVVSDLECFRDFVDDGITGTMFPHRSPDPVAALHATLKRVLSHRGANVRMGMQARVKAQEFGYQVVAADMMAIIESTIRRRADRGS